MSMTALIIMDGFGINPAHEGNAIYAAGTPHLDALKEKYSYTTGGASGMDVGLPEGQMGNSEVGHLNIGAGRIVYQELTRITKAIEDGIFSGNAALNKAIDHVLGENSTLHIFGLLSDGGVHSHIEHISDSPGRQPRCFKHHAALFHGRQRCASDIGNSLHRRDGKDVRVPFLTQNRSGLGQILCDGS